MNRAKLLPWSTSNRANRAWRAVAVLLGVVAVAALALSTPRAAALLRDALPTPQVAPPGTERPDSQASLPPVSWRAGEPGSALVLDLNQSRPKSRLLIVDKDGEVDHVAEMDANPMVTVSPTEDLLAIASTTDRGDTVQILRGADGSVLEEFQISNRMITFAPTPTMVLSGDGRYLFVLTLEILEPGVDRYGLSHIDVSTGELLASVDLGQCGVGTLLALSRGVAVACADDLFIYRGEADEPAIKVELELARGATPQGRVPGVAGGAVLPGERVMVIHEYGQIRVIDVLTGSVKHSGALELKGRGVLARQVVSVGGSEKVLLLTSTEPERVRGRASELVVFDTGSMRILNTVAVAATNLAVSADGTHVFTLDAAAATIRTFDPAGVLLATATDVGVQPWLIVAAY